jgi:hypothetical protein
VHRTRLRVADQDEPAVRGANDLDVEAAVMAFTGVHAGGEGVVAAVTDRGEEPVDPYRGAQLPLRPVLSGRGQHGRDERGQSCDPPRHGRLGTAEQLRDQGLGQVVPQVDQHHQNRPVRADDSAPSRVYAAGGIHLRDQVVDLLRAESGQNLHVRRPVRED